MSGMEVMTFEEEEVIVSPSCLVPRAYGEAAPGIAGQKRSAPAVCLADEEVSAFITRHVLERDAEFFDG